MGYPFSSLGIDKPTGKGKVSSESIAQSGAPLINKIICFFFFKFKKFEKYLHHKTFYLISLNEHLKEQKYYKIHIFRQYI